MDDEKRKQFETMAILRAYAAEIVRQSAADTRPSTAHWYRQQIVRMLEVQKQLDCAS